MSFKKTVSKETRKKISDSVKALALRGSKHPQWKEEAKYTALHMYVYSVRGKATHCEINPFHEGKRFEWASIGHKATHSPDDYIAMCPACHRTFDKNNLTVNFMRNFYGVGA